ncbi:unnamed protein product [Cuscuta campestris]|uniref:Probable purine permease n=1 Tax=Cuscuta campestris TaxID=132261 RepID=A0A484K3N3_9ASTE|nr:unnamed protein product [Cuscuta campestris]
MAMAVRNILDMKQPGEETKEEEKVIVEVDANDVNPKQQQSAYKWWAEMVVYSIFVLSSQTIGTLLGRLYFSQGGKSKWMATLVQSAGFPILIPFLFISSSSSSSSSTTPATTNPSLRVLAPLYTVLGLFGAGICMMYSVGLMYLPLTTYSLICASQLGFNAVFSFFLNAQNFTPYIVNSLVLLTLSATILVFGSGEGPANSSHKKYVAGFLSTVAASAGAALQMSLSQLAFHRIFKRKETFRLIVEMLICGSIVGSVVTLVGLFASGEWRGLREEMNGFGLGRVSYVMNLVGTAVAWQVFAVGSLGLIFKVSSLFSNVIAILGLPIPPVMAVFIFKDKMSGVKVISLLLALWGFVSYVYQHYLDDMKAKAGQKEQQSTQVSEAALIQRI